MASRRLCTIGCNQRAISCCEGCSQPFCQIHFNQHRNELYDEMNEVIRIHDDIKNSLEKQRQTGCVYDHLKRIYEWEYESTKKIKQRAHELRLKLGKFAENHYQDFSQKLQSLSAQINEYRKQEDFIEVDLHRCKQTLDELQLNFISPIAVNIEEHENDILVKNISALVVKRATNELFEQIFNNQGRIEENGKLVIQNNSNNYTEIRGKNEYTTGCHHIRLRIEEISGSWLFLGINSKLTPVKSQSYSSDSSYGWSCNNFIWSNGQHEPNTSENPIEMKNNDIINLFFDCDNYQIMMINERTNAKYELPVIIDQCPFPWQLHAILKEPNDRLRILSD